MWGVAVTTVVSMKPVEALKGRFGLPLLRLVIQKEKRL